MTVHVNIRVWYLPSYGTDKSAIICTCTIQTETKFPMSLIVVVDDFGFYSAEYLDDEV